MWNEKFYDNIYLLNYKTIWSKEKLYSHDYYYGIYDLLKAALLSENKNCKINYYCTNKKLSLNIAKSSVSYYFNKSILVHTTKIDLKKDRQN